MDYPTRNPPTLLTLPLELRLMIYGYLLAPRSRHHRIEHHSLYLDDSQHPKSYTSFIAVVRYIPAVVLSHTCHQLRLEITSLMKRELFVPFKEPLRLLFDISEYKWDDDTPDHLVPLYPPGLYCGDKTFLQALCAETLRMRHFPQITENTALRWWMEKAQLQRDCFREIKFAERLKYNSGGMCKHGRRRIDPLIEIRILSRQESGQVDLAAPLDSDSEPVQYVHRALLEYLEELEEADYLRKFWYQARSLSSGDIGQHHPTSRDLVVVDNKISEEEWLRDWEGDSYEDNTFLVTHAQG